MTPSHNSAHGVDVAADPGPASGIVPCGSRRWHCIWTHPAQEWRAEWSTIEMGFVAYLPLVLERAWTGAAYRIAPAFPRYLLVAFDAGHEQWRKLYRAQGVSDIILGPEDKPLSFPVGVVEALQARTSVRRVLDDPWVAGDAGAAVAAPEGRQWHSLDRLSPKARGDLLIRLFGAPGHE